MDDQGGWGLSVTEVAFYSVLLFLVTLLSIYIPA